MESSGMTKVLNSVSAKPQKQYSTGEEKKRGGGEGGLDVEGAPEEADEEAGSKVAESVDGGERAEGHAVLLLGDELGGQRIFKGFFGADVEASQNKNQGEQPQRLCSGAQKNRSDPGKAVARSEYTFAVRDMVAEPATRVGGSGVEDVVKSVKADGKAGGAGQAVSWGENSRGVENQ